MRIVPDPLPLESPDLDEVWKTLAARSASGSQDWQATFTIDEAGGIELVASREALVRFALEFVVLAHNGVQGSHLDFDAASWLNHDTAPMIVNPTVRNPN